MTDEQKKFCDEVIQAVTTALADRFLQIGIEHGKSAAEAYVAGITDGIRVDHSWRAKSGK